MVSMELSKTEAKEESSVSQDTDLPRYPYGLSLYLDSDALAKLGIADMPKVGGTLQLMATVKVTGTSERESQNQDGTAESNACVDLQIIAMELSGPAKDAAKSLYPNQN